MMKVNTIRRSRFFIFFSSVLEYGLHFATVASRRDPQFIVGGALEGTTVSFNARTQSAYTVIQGTIDRLEALDALDGIDTAARPYNPFATAS